MSFTASRPPAVAAVQWLCVVAVTVLVPHPSVVVLSLLGALGFGRLAGVPAGAWRWLLPMAAVIALTNPLFVQEGQTVLFSVGTCRYTLEALAYGVNMGGMLLAVTWWCRAYATVLTADKLMQLGGRRVPRLMLTLCMARRWLPLFTSRLAEVRRARRSLGVTDGRHRLKEAAEAFLAVIAWSLENAILSARSMEARGYALKGHTAYAPCKRQAGDNVRLAVTVAAFVLTAVLSEPFAWYPTVGAWLSVPSGCAAATAAVLLWLPMLWEGKERRRWRACRSNL